VIDWHKAGQNAGKASGEFGRGFVEGVRKPKDTDPENQP